MERLIEKAAVLVEALPYIQRFRDCVVVVKFGGSAMEDPASIREVLRDVVFMECAGMRPVVVHGGGKAISKRLAQEGVETRFVHGLRYTCERSIGIVDRVLHEEVNAGLVRVMGEHGGKPYPLSGKNVLRAQRLTVPGEAPGTREDLGHVGEVVNVDTEQIRWVLGRKQVPIITPLGRDMNGCVYNINADMAACRIAAELKAHKLVFLSDVPGILRDASDPGSLISTVRAAEVDELVAQEVVVGGMIPKIQSAVAALGAGTGKVHLIDGRVRHALLLEIFTDRGIGTQILP